VVCFQVLSCWLLAFGLAGGLLSGLLSGLSILGESFLGFGWFAFWLLHSLCKRSHKKFRG
jgi:hypothetical protein